jgi:uncharacterized membrane protein
MILLGNLLKLLHVLAAFALVGGEIGRSIAFQRAKKATDVKIVAEMLQLFTFLTRKFVSIGGLVTFLLGIITAGVQRQPILGFLQGASTNWVLAALVLYIIIMLMVAFIAIPRGKVLGQALGSAMGQGKITSDLTSALNDNALNNSFVIQDILILLIIILMVIKPF